MIFTFLNIKIDSLRRYTIFDVVLISSSSRRFDWTFYYYYICLLEIIRFLSSYKIKMITRYAFLVYSLSLSQHEIQWQVGLLCYPSTRFLVKGGMGGHVLVGVWRSITQKSNTSLCALQVVSDEKIEPTYI
jgi:hypothetical protein